MSATSHDQQSARTVPSSVDAIVVGAGFSGMYLLRKLREMNLSTIVFETGTDVGGTWYWNRYPGARVDVESLAYSYSFSEDLEQEYEWEERYPTQPEILRYARHVADRFDLRRDIFFETRVNAATYDESSATWLVRTDQGNTVTCRFFIMATGCLSSSKLPEIPGLDRFEGATYHTAHWPHEGVDFTGMRVGIIGTGSSGVQSIPVVAEQAADLTVFQRTPAYSLPARNRRLRSEEVADMKANYRAFRKAAQESGFGVPTAIPPKLPLADGIACCALNGPQTPRPVTGAPRATMLPLWFQSTHTDTDEIRPRGLRRGARRRLRGGLGKRQSGQPADLVCRSQHQPGGQRHREAVHPRQDPSDRQGSADRRGPVS